MPAKPYPSYNPSGVEWLGDVPEHWKVIRLKEAATYRVSNVDKVPSEEELPVRLCNYTDVYYNERIRPDMGLMETTATRDEIDRFHLRLGDVLITKDSEDWADIAVPALVEETAPDLVCGYHLAIVRPKKQYLDGGFLLRCLQSGAINQQFQLASSGVTRYGLPKGAIGDALIALPPLEEQRAIAAFLDAETEKIDTLVEKKQALIERLKEQRTALISRTVTRGLPPDAVRTAGLDPHPRLKPSGVEWLGDVPEHWEVKPLGYLVKLKGGATPDKAKPEFWEGKIPWISPKDMKVDRISDGEDHVSSEALNQSALQMIEPGSVLIVVRGMILAHSFPVAMSTAPLTINQDMKALTATPGLTPDYLYWSLVGLKDVMVSLTEESAHGTKRLDTAVLIKLPFAQPPRTEQDAVSAYLDRETRVITSTAQCVESAISKLQEYRSALITAAVTGKIDVRQHA